MKLKQILCGAMAAAITATTLCVPAFAATPATKLRTISQATIAKALKCDKVEIAYAGKNTLVIKYDKNGNISGFAAITEKNVEKWRSTGKFSITSLKTDVELDGYTNIELYADMDRYNSEDAYFSLVKGEEKDECIVMYDASKKKVIDCDDYADDVLKKGASIVYKGVNARGIAYAFIDEDGAPMAYDPYATTVDMVYFKNLKTGKAQKYELAASTTVLPFSGDKCAYMRVGNGNIYSVDAKTLKINEEENAGEINYISFDTPIAGENFYGVKGMMSISSLTYGSQKIEADSNREKSDNMWFTKYGDHITDLVSSVGNRVISGKIPFCYYYYSGDLYALVDLNSQTRISDNYLYMSEYASGKYLVNTVDGKWGYMNNNGKLLRTYDDCSSFSDGNAVVINKGKASVVNKNLKRVSGYYKFSSAANFGNGIFKLTKESGKVYYGIVA